MAESDSWTKQKLDSAIAELINAGLFGDPILQARPAWQIPGALLIAECQVGAARYWLIAGEDSPTDLITARLALNPRAAARHFAMKWQLAAEQLKGGQRQVPEGVDAEMLSQRVQNLIKCAESLAELSAQDALWGELESLAR